MPPRRNQDYGALEDLLTTPRRRGGDVGQTVSPSNAQLFGGASSPEASPKKPSLQDYVRSSPMIQAAGSALDPPKEDYASLMAELEGFQAENPDVVQMTPTEDELPPTDDSYFKPELLSAVEGDYPGEFYMRPTEEGEDELLFMPHYGPEAGRFATLNEFDGPTPENMASMGDFLGARRPDSDGEVVELPPPTGPVDESFYASEQAPGPNDTVDMRGRYVPKPGAPPLKIVDLGRVGGKSRR